MKHEYHDPRGTILPAREYEDAAEIHGRSRIPADFEKHARKQSVLQRARDRMHEQPEV